MYKAFCSVKCLDDQQKRAVIITPEFSSIEAMSDHVDEANKKKGALAELCRETPFFRSHEQEIYMMCYYDFNQFIVVADCKLEDMALIKSLYDRWVTEERESPTLMPITADAVDAQIENGYIELEYYHEFIDMVHSLFTKHHLVEEA